jgi:FimV-like protein
MAYESSMRALVADPSEKTRGIAGKILTDYGFNRVETAGGANEVRDALASGKTDYLLMDFGLAETGNFALLDEISLDKRLRSLLIMLMGVDVPAAKVDEALRIGARDYLNKPFTPYILMVKLDKMIYGPYHGRRDYVPGGAATSRYRQAQESFKQGYELLRLRKYDQAIAEFAKAARKRMLFPEAYKGIAEAFRGHGDLTRHEQFLSKAAETYAWLERHEDAEKAFRHARKVNSSAPNPYKTVGDHMKGQAAAAELVEVFERAVKLTPRDADTAMALSRACIEAGDKDKARQVLEAVVEKRGVPPEAEGLFLHLAEQKGRAERKISGILDGDQVEYKGPERRKAKRVPLAEYAAKLPKHKEYFTIVDVSSTGLSFKHGGESFEKGRELTFDLLLLGEPRVRKVTAKVVRMTKRVVGLEIVKIAPRQMRNLERIIQPA